MIINDEFTEFVAVDHTDSEAAERGLKRCFQGMGIVMTEENNSVICHNNCSRCVKNDTVCCSRGG